MLYIMDVFCFYLCVMVDPAYSEWLCNPAIPSASHATRTCLGRYTCYILGIFAIR